MVCSCVVEEIQFYFKMGNFRNFKQEPKPKPTAVLAVMCRLKAVVPLGPTPRFSNTTCTKGNTTMLVTRSKVDLLMQTPHKNFFDHERTLTCYVVAVRLTRYRSFGGTRCFIILKSSSRTSLSPIFIRIFLQKRREMY